MIINRLVCVYIQNYFKFDVYFLCFFFVFCFQSLSHPHRPPSSNTYNNGTTSSNNNVNTDDSRSTHSSSGTPGPLHNSTQLTLLTGSTNNGASGNGSLTPTTNLHRPNSVNLQYHNQNSNHNLDTNSETGNLNLIIISYPTHPSTQNNINSPHSIILINLPC